MHFDPAFKASLPPVGQVYWDYYHEDEQTYRERFTQHFELSSDVAFAGGIGTWSALAPNQSKMLATIDAGLKAAKASGVQQVVATYGLTTAQKYLLVQRGMAYKLLQLISITRMSHRR